MRPNLLVLTDSRGIKFQDTLDKIARECGLKPEEQFHKINFVAVPGAKVNDLLLHATEYFSKVQSKRFVLVKVFVGINNFTKKVYSHNNYELVLSNTTPTEVFQELLSLKLNIRKEHTRTIISFCNVPCADLVGVQKHRIERKGLNPTQSETRLFNETETLKIWTTQLNRKIKQENKQEQFDVVPQSISFDTMVLKLKKHGRKQLQKSALYDGLHPTDETARTWVKMLWKSVSKELVSLIEKKLVS